MLEIITHVLLHSLEETVKLLPFLFLTYLLMEFLEHKAAQKTADITAKAGVFGPFAGGLLGTIAEAREKTFLVEIANGVKIEISRASVQDVVPEEQPQAK
jgi:preprotein translocase subunit YajC